MQRIPALAAVSALALSLVACKVDGSVECSPDTQSCRVDVTRVTESGGTTSPPTTTTTRTTTTTTTTTPTTTTRPPTTTTPPIVG